MRDYEYNVLVLYCTSAQQVDRMVDWAMFLGLAFAQGIWQSWKITAWPKEQSND